MLRRRAAVVLGLAVLPALVVYGLVLGLSVGAGIKPILVIRDLPQTCEYPIGVGMMPSIGILLWTAAAAISLFSGCSGLVASHRWRQLLRVGGSLSALLALDDLFLLHDRYISQDALYLIYAVLAVFILLRFRDLVLEANAVAFVMAGLCLGVSVLFDKFQDVLPWAYAAGQVVEEGAKFIGIACWLLFWWQASARAVKLRA
jgi:hypothetical protein